MDQVFEYLISFFSIYKMKCAYWQENLWCEIEIELEIK
jgi:hypothetical protein